MKETPLMWTYWRDKYGYVTAIKDYFPEALQERADMQQAVAMIQNGERLLDSIFDDLMEKEDDDFAG